MPPQQDYTLPLARRNRRSVGPQPATEKENATVDMGSSLSLSRRIRSKSMGPGGLDALKQSAGNRRASLAAPVKPPRSILKPSIAPLPEIPPLKDGKKQAAVTNISSNPSPASSLPNQAALGSNVPLRTEEEQQAAAREREERERRDARRKSLANRRVSFAAEATLHTFHEVEYMQDSTTSTDSTRRASSSVAKSPTRDLTGAAGQDSIQAPADVILQSPEKLRRRRSSIVAPPNFNNLSDDTLASAVYSSDSEPADGIEEIVDDDGAFGTDSDDGTMMTMDAEEMTGTSVASDRSTATAEDSTLDEALRIAAQRAGASGREKLDDSDDGEEIIPSFGWVKKGNQSTNKPASSQSPTHKPTMIQEDEEENETEMDMDIDMDVETTSAVGRILKPSKNNTTSLEGDASMDVTRAFGGILPRTSAPATVADQDELMEDATMEFTKAMGVICDQSVQDADDIEDHEDMSMELTSIMGGVLSQPRQKRAAASRRQSLNRRDNGETGDVAMDMTAAVGRIISMSDDETEEDADATTSMDMTAAIGTIIEDGQESARTLNKRIMEEEADRPNSPKKAIIAAVAERSPSRTQPFTLSSAKKSPESPGLSAFQGKGLRRSLGPPKDITLKSSPRSHTPSPSKVVTPQRQPASASRRSLAQPSPRPLVASPAKPRSVERKGKEAVSPAGTSPRRASSFHRDFITGDGKPSRASPRRASLFQHNTITGDSTPTVVLTPVKRRLSGVGIDRPGLGSPQVAALCDRRGSIGELASTFVPGKRVVSFGEAEEMKQEVDKERQDEKDKENRRLTLEREADGSQEEKDATLNLREMIDSLSPKWKPVKGRKSLHVGSASGLLGKRPAELDDDDEAENIDGVKRLKGYQGSPVNKVRLPQPDSETSVRLTRLGRKSLENVARTSTPPVPSPGINQPATTPQKHGRFRDVEDDTPVHGVDLRNSTVKDESQLEREADVDRMHLQDFLNMTSIRFMELTTTKRRHTMAAGKREGNSGGDAQDDLSLERCVVAGACTVPMLELYQHSCRELKQYISEGRRMVKEIEHETFEENPPLFREYMTATADVRTLMDSQFKNVKTHARLLSKAMWYEWRMKLQDGLKEGLMSMAEGMERDSQVLDEQQKLLASVLPAVKGRYEALKTEEENLEHVAREMDDCDPGELDSARHELAALEKDVDVKKQQIAELRQELEQSEAEVEEVSARKVKCSEELNESERMREKYRGWTSQEVKAIKARVEALERKYGWSVTACSKEQVCLAYRREVEVVVDVGATPAIDVRLSSDVGKEDGRRQEEECLLQVMRQHAKALHARGAETRVIIGEMQAGWDTARTAPRQIDRINVTFPTKVSRRPEGSGILAATTLLLAPLRSKVEVRLLLDCHCGGGGQSKGITVEMTAEASVVYGEQFNVGKMQEFITSRTGRTVNRAARGEDWGDVLVELQRRLIARGRK